MLELIHLLIHNLLNILKGLIIAFVFSFGVYCLLLKFINFINIILYKNIFNNSFKKIGSISLENSHLFDFWTLFCLGLVWGCYFNLAF